MCLAVTGMDWSRIESLRPVKPKRPDSESRSGQEDEDTKLVGVRERRVRRRRLIG